jgi:3-oxoacyl-[acyl-carrier protein] reductase
MPADNELSGLTAVITGASSGIGAAIALELATAGANCLLHWRSNQDGIASVEQLIRRRTAAQCALHQCDLSIPAEQDRLVEAAWQWKKIDIWVNNAGADVLTGAAAKWTFEEKLDCLLATDLVPTMRLSRLAGRRMRDQGGGAIVNIGWDQAETGMAGDSGELFAATKGAVMAATRSLAKSLAPTVRANCVAPGWIRTAWGEHASEFWQNRARNDSLLARWGTPEDVAAAVRFLCSPAASFITGHILPVNGGLARLPR